MLRQLITSPVVRTVVKKPTYAMALTRQYHGPPAPGCSMDDLPVPSGSWEAQYKANQTKYNMHLAMGIIFFSVTVLVAKASGLLYMNFSRPPLPKEQ